MRLPPCEIRVKAIASPHNQKEETITIFTLKHSGGKAAIAFISFILTAAAWVPLLFAADHLFASLEKRLISDGVNADFVQAIYRNPLIKLESNLMASNLKRREATLNYGQFLTDATVAQVRQYMDKRSRALGKAYQRFGVPPSIIAAILMVETRLGTYTGKFLTINVLSTMAVAADPQVQKQILARLSSENAEISSSTDALKRLQARATRGYNELKAYLDYVQKNGKDPFQVKGSSEGAIGISQFLPSNIDRYGHDLNGDGVIDLFDHEDAIASVAAYLHAHHWGKAKTEKEKKRVLLTYNRSLFYVDTICALALRLEAKSS